MYVALQHSASSHSSSPSSERLGTSRRYIAVRRALVNDAGYKALSQNVFVACIGYTVPRKLDELAVRSSRCGRSSVNQVHHLTRCSLSPSLFRYARHQWVKERLRAVFRTIFFLLSSLLSGQIGPGQRFFRALRGYRACTCQEPESFGCYFNEDICFRGCAKLVRVGCFTILSPLIFHQLDSNESLVFFPETADECPWKQ